MMPGDVAVLGSRESVGVSAVPMRSCCEEPLDEPPPESPPEHPETTRATPAARAARRARLLLFTICPFPSQMCRRPAVRAVRPVRTGRTRAPRSVRSACRAH